MSKDIEFSFTLPSDIEGYIEYECPFCEEIFRLNKNFFQGEQEMTNCFVLFVE